VEYIVPTGPLPTDNYSIQAAGFDYKLPSVREREYSFGPNINHTGHGWQRHYYLHYARDQFRFDDQSGIVTHVLTPGVSLNRTALDNAINPSLGYTLFIDVHGGAQQLLSNSTFLQIHEIFRGIAPLFHDVHLLTRFEYGASLVRNFEFYPVSQRFFAGGQESVRGYSYQSLAPHDPTGNIIGGRYLTTGTLELQWLFRHPYALAVFTDAGGASNSPAVSLHRSAGGGLVYRAPFGSIEADLSHPFDSGLEPVRLDLDVRVGL
jgi:translocation and assembly module TamA